MSLTPGTRLGSYEIVSPLGAGGMGEVFRARDTKLDRDVAIKVLPESFAADADRVARFTREAKTLASLNHPNIAQIYGIEENAIVMELVEGQDLSALISKSAALEDQGGLRTSTAGAPGLQARGIPLAEALPIARQIADALEAAHEQGIVHRDLKPQNIKVRADGTVKVLDFGLAKAMDPDPSATSAMNSPTMTARATQMGMIIGTAAYMAPEQAKGKAVDKRADIWAFGVVLYEMLTGRRCFDGEDISTTLAAVLMREPEWTALPKDTPPALDSLVRRCLERDPKARLRDIGEARVLLSNPQTMSGSPAGVATAPAAIRSAFGPRAIAAVVTVMAATALVTWWLKPVPQERTVVSRFSYALPEGHVFSRTGRHVATISPDGTKIAYVANGQLYVRAMGSLDPQLVSSVQDDLYEPVFSPDGQSIAYFVPGADGGATLKRVDPAGGAPVTLVKTTSGPWGVSWRNGLIAFGQADGSIQAVPETGGTLRVLVKAEASTRAVQPQLQDDGTHLLYTVMPAEAVGDEGQVILQRLDGAERTVLLSGGTNAKILPSGHLIYIHNATVFAMPYDASRRAVAGAPVAVVDGVGETSSSWAGQFTISDTGTLVYRPGAFSFSKRALLSTDRQGRELAVFGEMRDHALPRVSPDGSKFVVTSNDGEKDLWLWDLAKSAWTRLTFGAAVDGFAVWMPDSRHVVFRSADAGRTDIVRRAVDGTGNVEPVSKTAIDGIPESISPDGKFLVYRTGSLTSSAASELHLLPLASSNAGSPNADSARLLAKQSTAAAVSPDGRWVAYESVESGRTEVYVRPFPNVDGGKWMVSSSGGGQPAWSRSGRELYYLSYPRLMSVPVLPAAAFSYGTPHILFANLPYSFGPYGFGSGRAYDVTADGRFLFMKSEGAPTAGGYASLVVVSNWFDELRAKVPVKR